MASSNGLPQDDNPGQLPGSVPHNDLDFEAENQKDDGVTASKSTAIIIEKNIGKRDLYFADGARRIDYVIAYSHDDSLEDMETRRIFENNLRQGGLELELEPKENSPNKETVFVKLHVPWDICLLYAERMRMKMPLKVEDEDLQFSLKSRSVFRRTLGFSIAAADSSLTNESFHTAEFMRSKMEFFDIRDSETFFSPAKRSRIAYRVMAESFYGDEKKDIGIERLLLKGIYKAAFPLHEGEYEHQDSKSSEDQNQREILYLTWARWRNWYKVQPLHSIRQYFGEKVAIFCSFVQFYTFALLLPTLVGLLVTIYGLVMTFQSSISKETCDESYPTYAGNLTMCPLCDQECSYWKLRTACRATIGIVTQVFSLVHQTILGQHLFGPFKKVSHVFDNESAIFFAIFMSLWATMFLKFWKREQYRLSYEWDLVEYDEETALIRPEYEAYVTRERMNPITHTLEPHMGKLARFSRSSFSIVNVIFWISIVLAAVISVTVFRLAMHAVFSSDETMKTLENLDNVISPSVLTTLTASMLSVLVILILNKVYEKVALWLTYVELPRTQLEFEDSFTLKMFCFQFVNYYSFLFYVAFFKNSLTGIPGNYFYFFGKWRWEECDSGGCMYELTLQLFVIMFAKQMWNNIIEFFVPWLTRKYRFWKSTKCDESEADYMRWDRDYDLHKFGQLDFFYEYLELVIQYGFVTLFVVAFPLAPLLALLNNIVEIRLDAHKLVCSFRRPLAQKAATIGAWYFLLDFLSTLAVVTNSFTLAVTSATLPQMVYYYSFSLDTFEKRTLMGYTENSLSVFNVTDFPPHNIPQQTNPFPGEVVTECRYRDYRSPPSSSPQYHVTTQYWHTQAARVILIVVIEHFVFFLRSALDLALPDEPPKIRDQVKREHYLVQNMLLKAEKEQFRKDLEKSLAGRHKMHTAIKRISSLPDHVTEILSKTSEA